MAVADVVVSFLLLVSIYGILALGLNIKYGHTGLLDFGHVGFYLIGAYTAALFVLGPDTPDDFTVYIIGLGNVPLLGTWPIAILAGTLLAAVIGGLVTLPTIRLREDYLAITVLGISVIFQRVIQSETWLANGPDALRGYSPPLQSYFPVTGQSLVGAVLFGVFVAVVWGLTTAGFGWLCRHRSTPLQTRLYQFTALGQTATPLRGAVLAALGVGAITTVVVVLFGIILPVGLVVSIYTWTIAVTAVRLHYSELSRPALITAILVGSGLLVSLVPLAVIETVSIQIAVTLSALSVLVLSYYIAIQRSAVIAANRLSIIGVGSLWFVSIWYFVLPLVDPLTAGRLTGALQTLFQNLVWMLAFGGDVGVGYVIIGLGELTVQLDYPRIQLAGFILFLTGLFYIVEQTVQTPFGRVLRAIRNDETVVESLGKNPFTYKLQSMMIGSGLAGFAGALWAMYAQGLTFTTFAPRVTFIILLIMFVGGVGNNKGMIFGAALFWAFQQATTQLAGFFPPAIRVNIQAFRLVIVGILFLIVLYYLPEGLLTREGSTTGEQRTRRTEGAE
ncbi:MAG: ABC-type branched-chain amino acid transport system, permease component [Haloquadratum sp. J07HQX50]|nr:MAG: ABC-type branched-chain amino acid transport system, permease component [Haloquadratum sp. J07HQX50]